MFPIAERLRVMRIAAGLSQQGLARRAGVSDRTVRRLEAGGEPTTESVLRLARALDVSFQSFLEDTSPEYEAQARADRRRLGVT